MSRELNSLTMLVAIAGFLLSLFNVVRSSYISDRQFSLAWSQEATKWAVDVLQVFSDAQEVYQSRDMELPSSTIAKFSSVQRNLFVLFHHGSLLFPVDTSSYLAALDQLHIYMKKDILNLQHQRDLLYMNDCGITQGQFASQIARSVGAMKRYRLAHKNFS